MRPFLADLSLLKRPVAGFITAGVVATGALTSWITRDGAARQTSVIEKAVSSSGLDPHTGPCGITGTEFDPQQCLALAPGTTDTFWLGDLLTQVPKLVEAASATSLSGALGFAARQSASLIGFVALILIISIHVCSAWDQGTARPLIASLGTKMFVFQKAVSSVVVAFVLPVLSAIGVLLGSLIPISGRIPTPVNVFNDSLLYLLRASGTLLAFSLIVVGAALIMRNIVGAVLCVIIPLVLCYIAASSRMLAGWSPVGWIAKTMSFSSDDRRQVADFFWVAVNSRISGPASWLLWASLAVAAFAIAAFVFPRRKPIA